MKSGTKMKQQNNMEYTVSFTFSCIDSKSMISTKNATADISAESTAEELKKNSQLIALLASDMAQKTKKSILSLEILEVVEHIKK